MAKKQVNPLIFRAGITQNWPTNLKLENYTLNFFYSETIQNRLSDHWGNKTLRKILLKRSLRRWRSKGVQKKLAAEAKQKLYDSEDEDDVPKIFYFQFLKKRIETRRRGLLFRVTLARFRLLKVRRLRRFFHPRVEYWYKKTYKNLAKKKHLLRSVQPFLRDERQIVWYRNYVNMELSKMQSNLRILLRSVITDARSSVAGSTVLRRYQCNITAIQPPFWTRSIRLKHASFKKIAGYVIPWRRERGLGIHYLILLSQMNLALQWRSGFLFVNLIKEMLEQRRRVQGSLRLVHELLNRMNLTRYNILCIKMKIIGSFGKLTRSKTVKLGKIGRGVSHSVTNLSQPVSYASTQVWTIRGALGLRVWIFW